MSEKTYSLDGPTKGLVPHYIALADEHLYNSQKNYEKCYEAFKIARKACATAELAYKAAHARWLENNAKTGKVTIAKELALLACKGEYEEFLMAQSERDIMEAGIAYYKELNQTCKQFLKIKFNDFNSRGG